MEPKIGLHHAVLCMVFITGLFLSCDTGGGTPPGDPVPDENERFLAVGGNGTIIYSDDNGVTFTAVADSGTEAVLRGAAADDQGHCVAVGYDGTFLYSADYGVTWHAGTVNPNPTINNVNRVVCYGTNKFVAVGEPTGRDPYGIFRSADGGQTWDRYPATITLKGVGTRSETDFVAVGTVYQQNEAACYLTYTAGDSWTLYSQSGQNPAIPVGTETMHDVVSTINSYFVAVGRGGSLYSSTGATWTAGGSVTCVLTAAAWGNPPGRLVAVGDSGEVIYSPDTGIVQDGGISWAHGNSGVSVALWGICCVQMP